MWNPKIQNCVQPIAMDRILQRTVKELYNKRIIGMPLEVLKDGHGTWGFRYGQFILLARKYVYGNIISVHKTAIAKAIEYAIPIVIYLADSRTFYKIDPETIIKEKLAENMKGQALMVNFNIGLCRRIDFR
jgi:hypothetical protein